jgi:hypothetical protein
MVALEAGPKARAEIAERLDLAELATLEADIALRPWLDGVEIDGRVRAEATRICGLSLEPFEVEIDEPFLIRVTPEGSPNAPTAEASEIIVDLGAEDPPEVSVNGLIDISAYAVEALALALDPFPRKPGAVFSPPEAPTADSPFAALSALAKRQT